MPHKKEFKQALFLFFSNNNNKKAIFKLRIKQFYRIKLTNKGLITETDILSGKSEVINFQNLNK